MTSVLQVWTLFTSNALFNTWVSLLVRNGIWTCFWFAFPRPILHNARARMQSFSVVSDLLISRVSAMRSREWCWVSALASLPARSTRRKHPSGEFGDSLFITRIRQIACERDDWSFLVVDSVERSSFAVSMILRNSSEVAGFFSRTPTSCIAPKGSSRMLIAFRSLRRSNWSNLWAPFQAMDHWHWSAYRTNCFLQPRKYTCVHPTFQTLFHPWASPQPASPFQKRWMSFQIQFGRMLTAYSFRRPQPISPIPVLGHRRYSSCSYQDHKHDPMWMKFSISYC